MGADSFKGQGIQLQLSGRRVGTPALGPQGGGVSIVQRPDPAGAAPGQMPGFSIKPSSPQPAQPTAPLGGSKIPSMKTSQAGGGARDQFSPAAGGRRVVLLGAGQAAEAPEIAAPAQPQHAPQGAALSGGGEEVVLCEAIAEMPDGQRWSAPYEAVFPKGAKFLGVKTTAR